MLHSIVFARAEVARGALESRVLESRVLGDVSPNSTGLPGISTLSNIVGALLTIGLIACVAGLVIAAIVWAIGTHSSNPHLSSRGKTGVLVAFAAAILIGGANVLVDFFVATGKGI
jgi:hypothetical protein